MVSESLDTLVKWDLDDKTRFLPGALSIRWNFHSGIKEEIKKEADKNNKRH